MARVACALLLPAVSGEVLAQSTYPEHAVKIIVPFTPATGIDILARTLGQKMGEEWKQPVVVENRAAAAAAASQSGLAGRSMLSTANPAMRL